MYCPPGRRAAATVRASTIIPSLRPASARWCNGNQPPSFTPVNLPSPAIVGAGDRRARRVAPSRLWAIYSRSSWRACQAARAHPICSSSPPPRPRDHVYHARMFDTADVCDADALTRRSRCRRADRRARDLLPAARAKRTSLADQRNGVEKVDPRASADAGRRASPRRPRISCWGGTPSPVSSRDVPAARARSKTSVGDLLAIACRPSSDDPVEEGDRCGPMCSSTWRGPCRRPNSASPTRIAESRRSCPANAIRRCGSETGSHLLYQREIVHSHTTSSGGVQAVSDEAPIHLRGINRISEGHQPPWRVGFGF